MTSVLHIREEQIEGTLIVILDGELDASSVGEVAVKLRRMAQNRAHRLIVDLARVDYLDSAGINLLYTIAGEVSARQQALHLVVVPGSPIERTLQVVGADRAFPLHGSREEALES